MFTTSNMTSQKNGVAAFAVMTLTLLALVFKASLPVGFMPVLNKDGFTEIVICSGMDEKTILVPIDDASAPNHQEQKGDKVCEFQALASVKTVLGGSAFTLTVPASSSVSTGYTSEQPFRSFTDLSFAARGPPSV